MKDKKPLDYTGYVDVVNILHSIDAPKTVGQTMFKLKGVVIHNWQYCRKISNIYIMKVAVKKTKVEVKKGKDKGLTPYKSQVLNVNRALKVQNKSFGGCISMLLGFSKDIGLDAKRVKILRFVQKDDAAFKSFKGLVRTSKNGNYCPFYVLQALNKNISDMTLADAKEAKAKKATVKK